MNNDDIFTIIWRIGVVVPLLLMLAALIAVGSALIYYVIARRRAAFDARVTLLAEREGRLGFGDFQFIKGTRCLMSAYGPPYELKSSLPLSYGGSAARNYLFVHVDDQTMHYLLPTLTQVILTAEMLRVGDGSGRNTLVPWLYFHIVDSDTNGDGRLTEEDGFPSPSPTRTGRNCNRSCAMSAPFWGGRVWRAGMSCRSFIRAATNLLSAR